MNDQLVQVLPEEWILSFSVHSQKASLLQPKRTYAEHQIIWMQSAICNAGKVVFEENEQIELLRPQSKHNGSLI